jgi:Sulfotransferase domain
MIVWLASYPRSGNTFCRVLLKQLYDVSTYDLHEPNPPPRPQYEHLIGNARLEVPISDLHRDERVHVVKTHETPRDDYPAIYLVRDGRDAVVSFARFAMAFGSSGTCHDYPGLLRHLLESPGSYGGWSRNVRTWTGRRAPTALVRFDDLIARPTTELRRAMAAIGLAMPDPKPSNPPTFGDLHELSPLFFRKGRTGAWREEMPYELHLLFWRRHGATMRALGYMEGEPTAEELAGRATEIGERLSFGIGGAGCDVLGEGWAEPEVWGTWSVERRASLHLSVGRHHAFPLEVLLSYRSFVERRRTLDITCHAGEHRVSSWTCSPENWRGLQRISLPAGIVSTAGTVNLDFEISEPQSPAELGLGSDMRELGLGIESMQLTNQDLH